MSTPSNAQPPQNGDQPSWQDAPGQQYQQGQQPNFQEPGQPYPPQGQPQYYNGYPPQQPQKKKHGCLKIGCLGLIGLVLLIGIISAIAGAMGGGDNDTSNGDPGSSNAKQDVAPTETPKADTAVLEVEATGGANVTYGGMGSTNTADANGSWSQEIPVPEEKGLTLSVQDMSMSDSAKVTCRMTIGGEVVAEESATGSAAIASCVQPLF